MGKARKKIYFNENEILVASKILKEIKFISGFMNVLMNRNSNTFSAMIICNQNRGFYDVLVQQKRDSDVVKVISEEMGLYYVIAQETEEIGATKFLKRLVKAHKENVHYDSDPYAAVVSIKNKVKKEDIVFNLIQEFIFYSKLDSRFRMEGITTSVM